MLHIVLVEPEIPPNTGNIGRLSLAIGARLHLVRPLGFEINDRQLRRAGLDYWRYVDLVMHDSLDAFLESAGDARLWLLTTKAKRPFDEVEYADGDYLVFGRESKGLPESLLAARSGSCLTIPMLTGCPVRSLNLSVAAGIVAHHAWRSLTISAKGPGQGA